MFIGRVAGTVVCTRKVEGLSGFKLLLVKKLDLQDRETGDFSVVVDVVGAGNGERVLVVAGSSARQTAATTGKPVDGIVAGIIDTVTIDKPVP
ncbi:MAG: ethanolamine utilization protein EutN [bacterium]|nr:MAG: ethanolamine utilization protein EutN [bacterium]